MSRWHVSNGRTSIDTVDIREVRQFIKGLQAQNAQLEKEKSEAELNLLAQNTNSFSPVAANLSANINTAAQMDAQQVTTLVNTFLSQMKQEVLAVFQQSSTHPSHTGPSLSAAPSGSQVSTGPQGVFSPPGPQPFNGLSASPSAGGPNNSTLAATVLNEYDKAVEVDQRKLRNPELTPAIALRKLKLTYNRYAKKPNSSSTKQQHGERTSATNTSSSCILLLSAAAHRSESAAQLPDDHN